jgi:hypothetical protein
MDRSTAYVFKICSSGSYSAWSMDSAEHLQYVLRHSVFMLAILLFIYTVYV